LKKTDGSWIFWSIFDILDRHKWLIGFIEKQAPQKALCLGPDPPPGEKWIFIENYRFFMILGASIEPEKPSVKSASTPYPPRKVKFIDFLIIRDAISSRNHLFDHYPIVQHLWDPLFVCFVPAFFEIGHDVGSIVFLCWVCFCSCFLLDLVVSKNSNILRGPMA
jgi:hypothetical protein